VRGCTRVSEGCRNCYAERQAARFSDPGQYAHGFVERTPSGPRWTGKVELIESKLAEPLSWRKPRRVFVNSMSDLFHEGLPDEAIDRIFAIMAVTPQHTYQVLTKRPERMREYMREWRSRRKAFPLQNVWAGVSCEDQVTADDRMNALADTPASVRFLSMEPLLGPISMDRWAVVPDWVIVGGESGPAARQCHVDWIRSIVRQCRASQVRVFVKQLGACSSLKSGRLRDSKGGDPSEWPRDLRVREFPEEFE
jgi:protein gp37